MISWRKEHIQLTAKRNYFSRRGKVSYDDVEVGQIRPGSSRGSNSSGEVSYTISSAPYGTFYPPFIRVPQSSITPPP